MSEAQVAEDKIAARGMEPYSPSRNRLPLWKLSVCFSNSKPRRFGVRFLNGIAKSLQEANHQQANFYRRNYDVIVCNKFCNILVKVRDLFRNRIQEK